MAKNRFMDESKIVKKNAKKEVPAQEPKTTEIGQGIIEGLKQAVEITKEMNDNKELNNNNLVNTEEPEVKELIAEEEPQQIQIDIQEVLIH